MTQQQTEFLDLYKAGLKTAADLMKAAGIADVLLTGGGIISKEDMAALKQKGVGELFGPGTSTAAIIDYIRKWVMEHRGSKVGA